MSHLLSPELGGLIAQAAAPTKLLCTMRFVLLCSLLGLAVGCLPEDEERCYGASDPDRPDMPHLVLNEATGACVRVDGGTEKDASMDSDVPDESVPECSEDNACTDRGKARCNQGVCQACSDHSHCAQFTDTPVCKDGRCNQCATNIQCTSPGAAKCFAGSCTQCELDTDCSHLEGTSICHDGSCVECTAQKDAACTGVCVIEPLTEAQSPFTCDDDLSADSAGSCTPCVASKQCSGGRVCVSMRKAEVELGNFCLWPEDAVAGPDGDCLSTRPYIQAEALTPVEGGDAISVCSLRLTTCQGLADFSAKDCMTLDETGDALCGAEGVEDGYCIKFNDANNQCTVPCGSANDCPVNFDTCAEPASRTVGGQKVCGFTSN